MWRGTAELGVELLVDRRVTSLDLDTRTATDDAGEKHSYEKLLLPRAERRAASRPGTTG